MDLGEFRFEKQGGHRIHKTKKAQIIQYSKTSTRILEHHHETKLLMFCEVLKRKNMGPDGVRDQRAKKPQDSQDHKTLK